ncbi:MAG: AtpZ/AtpI family protein [Patescibacteria group bacterium]
MANSEQDRQYMMLGLRIVGEFGVIIAAPIVILAVLGHWLDERYSTAPLFLIGGFILAAVLSGISIYRRAKQFGREYLAIEKIQSKNQENNISGKK